ncbi:MAG: NAD(P)-binding domain-containing protein [Pseudomonadota bacterium]
MVQLKHLVIGAGPVGLAMADAMKRQSLPYDHVDAKAGLGGLWYDGTYPGCHIVSSKRATAYTGYPMPDDYPDFPSAAQMRRYLESFAQSRGLAETIESAMPVRRAVQRPDDLWRVTFASGEARTYRSLIVCTGHHWDPRMPDLPGTFEGDMLHAKAYRGPEQLAGKRVLVIGGGNSGCDIASEAARVAAHADWSLRGGYWFLPKTVLGRAVSELPIGFLPVMVQRALLKGVIALTLGDYRRYGLPKPDHKLFERHPTYGTDALAYMRQGRLTRRVAPVRWTPQGVAFEDGSQGRYDVIVCATGYHNTIPFLDEGIVARHGDAFQLYGGAFPEEVKNLAIVGSYQPRNGFGPLIAPATQLFAKLIAMQDEIEAPVGRVLKWTGESAPRTLFIDPYRARRQIWIGERLLPLFKLQARLYAWQQARRAARAGAGATSDAVSARQAGAEGVTVAPSRGVSEAKASKALRRAA